jgi:hypothetical protein
MAPVGISSLAGAILGLREVVIEVFRVQKLENGLFSVVAHPKYGAPTRETLLVRGTKEQAKEVMKAYQEEHGEDMDKRLRGE